VILCILSILAVVAVQYYCLSALRPRYATLANVGTFVVRSPCRGHISKSKQDRRIVEVGTDE